jgi:hypothetical protein
VSGERRVVRLRLRDRQYRAALGVALGTVATEFPGDVPLEVVLASGHTVRLAERVEPSADLTRALVATCRRFET